jgi:hypothetical protein
MREVIVIGSVHSGNSAFVYQLYKLLLDVRPEVIFEEQSLSQFDQVYREGKVGSIESMAIKMYLENYSAINIPIDLEGQSLLNVEAVKNVRKMFNTFRENDQYSNFYDKIDSDLSAYGFPYLNSDVYRKNIMALHEMEARLVQYLNIPQLTKTYETWLKANNERETAWLEKIYSTQTKYNKAVLIIGAEHLNTIHEKVKKIVDSGNNELKWNFNYFE